MTGQEMRSRTPGYRAGQADPGEVAALERDVAVPIEEIVDEAERAAQARYEGVDPADSITFFGHRYRIAPRVGYMPMLDFAHEAAKGTNAEDLAGLAAMRDMLWRCFILAPPCRRCAVCKGTPAGECENPPDGDGGRCGTCPGCQRYVAPDLEGCPSYDPGDWPDFHLAALDYAAEAEDLFDVVQQVMAAVAARPTRRRSGSSPSALNGSPRSKELSSSRPAPPGVDGLVSVDDLTRAR